MNTPPDSNPKTLFGIAKPSTAAVPPVFVFAVGEAMADGARKYGRFNWREHAITVSVYTDALDRHMAAWRDGQDVAPDSGIDHLAHAAACLAILMDARAHGTLNDDRGIAGPAPAYLAANTKPIAPAAACVVEPQAGFTPGGLFIGLQS